MYAYSCFRNELNIPFAMSGQAQQNEHLVPITASIQQGNAADPPELLHLLEQLRDGQKPTGKLLVTAAGTSQSIPRVSGYKDGHSGGKSNYVVLCTIASTECAAALIDSKRTEQGVGSRLVKQLRDRSDSHDW